ncbi:MAG TPA: hypothetical protein VEK07_11095 [Polyangiaceae bacterium]|nr:hypothetical protein [Polyangiaceae bacterium]
MNTCRMIVWALPIALSASVGCSHESETVAPVTPPGASTVGSTAPPVPPAQPPATAEGAGEQHESRRTLASWLRDPGKALLDAASELSDTDAIPLSDAQQTTLHAQQAKLESSREGVKTAFQRLRADLANQVRVGVIDAAKMQADQAVIVNALRFRGLQEAQALDALHASLDPMARSDVVAAARTQRTGMTEPQPTAPSGATESAADRQRDHLDRWTRELSLDSTQQQQVAAILAAQPAPAESREENAQHADELLKAFESDAFDGATAVETTSPSPIATVYDHVQRKVEVISQMLPILRPGQRETLASLIETRRMGPAPDHGD